MNGLSHCSVNISRAVGIHSRFCRRGQQGTAHARRISIILVHSYIVHSLASRHDLQGDERFPPHQKWKWSSLTLTMRRSQASVYPSRPGLGHPRRRQSQ
ncbi:hypothetical protein K503DRAFT_112465 [Rhizopogon vinicolor AM-OR11-026]|uniref:Uncharacterized protein n=1 Tax=Rhizopogon vinicolor AM-OR11-026 TaxID=1314800 RepID=A0A1B7N2K2_9AGAM|nr:hypothetical protein K503DRAFT_112465 [Rhizopogon vinicolor AM-OR11-026]